LIGFSATQSESQNQAAFQKGLFQAETNRTFQMLAEQHAESARGPGRAGLAGNRVNPLAPGGDIGQEPSIAPWRAEAEKQGLGFHLVDVAQ